MARTEIRYYTATRDVQSNLIVGEQILDPEIKDTQDAMKWGCKRFEEIKSEKASWLLQLSMKRVAEEVAIDIYLRVGPEPENF